MLEQSALTLMFFSNEITDLPPEYQDIQYYFPYLKSFENKELHISHLMIPSDGNPAPLRRLLGFLINVLSPKMPKKIIKKLLRETEKQVLTANINYYVKLKELLEDELSETADDRKFEKLNQLIHLQQKSLSTYRKRNL